MRTLAVTFFVVHLLTADTSVAQNTIVVDTIIQTSFCAGGSVVIPYSLPNGDYNFGNVFTAQLSGDQDLLCLFETFENPIDIGALPYWGGGFILGQVPDSMTLGTYRIRMISSDPPDTSNISPNCLLITNLPGAVFAITGTPADDTLCQGDSVELSVSPLPISYEWSTGETSPTIWVSNSGSYTVSVRDTLGCETTSDPYTIEFEVCIGVDELSQSISRLSIHPVPASNAVMVEFTSNANLGIGLGVYNLLGELVSYEQILASTGPNGYWLDISGLQEGVYFLRIGENTDYQTQKFLKM
jgi:hypothetical protein